MAYIEKRITQSGDIRYKAQVRLKGCPIQTATFKRLTDARLWAKNIESAIHEGRHFKTAESKKRTVKELIERYEKEVLPAKPKAKQENHFKWWKGKLGRYVLADLTPSLIGECRDLLLHEVTVRGKRRAEGTVIRYLAALSHALTVARDEWEWIEQSPMDKVRKPSPARGRVRFLNNEERHSLLEACKSSHNLFLYPIVVLALSTGMRKGEILNLKWSDIDFERNRLVINESKNGERRSLPIAGLALELIKKLKEENGLSFSYIFYGKAGQNGQKPIDIRSAWEYALKVSKVENFKFHDLRHSAASYLAMNGATLSEIAEVLGHKTLAMVKRYSHISEEHTSKVIERMNQQIFS